MPTMQISLTDPLNDWIQERARIGRFGDAEDYVRDLIRRDQERAGHIAELQRLVADGLASGVSERTMDQVIEDARQEARTSASR